MSYVTIIIPYKNNLKYLFLALKSILNQTYKNYKILVIYDDENKSDLILLKKFIIKKKKKFKFSIQILVNNRNLGAGESRNKGIKHCKTKYIAFLDSDDVWHKNKLKEQIKFMKKNHLIISHTSYLGINDNLDILFKRKAKKVTNFNDLICSCDIGLSTVMLNTNFIKKNNLFFPNDIKTKEDYVFWLRIIRKSIYIRGLNKNLTYYRKTKNSLSSNIFMNLYNGYNVYRKFMKYNFITSCFCLFRLSINYLRKKNRL